MCTVTWLQNNDEYHLFSNRDEKLSRPSAHPPRVLDIDGVRCIAPIDAAFGGTWVFANEFGVSACLLNGASRGSGITSRGLIALHLGGVHSQLDAMRRIAAADLSNYAGFSLLLMELGRSPVLFEWAGSRKCISEPRRLLTSSSVNPGEVRRERSAKFAEIEQLTPAALRAFHRSHFGGPDACSPCMHRSDAKTVSFTSIYVNRQSVEFRYQPGAPCEGSPVEELWINCC